jgi:hypothetical protein
MDQLLRERFIQWQERWDPAGVAAACSSLQQPVEEDWIAVAVKMYEATSSGARRDPIGKPVVERQRIRRRAAARKGKWRRSDRQGGYMRG